MLWHYVVLEYFFYFVKLLGIFYSLLLTSVALNVALPNLTKPPELKEHFLLMYMTEQNGSTFEHLLL